MMPSQNLSSKVITVTTRGTRALCETRDLNASVIVIIISPYFVLYRIVRIYTKATINKSHKQSYKFVP